MLALIAIVAITRRIAVINSSDIVRNTFFMWEFFGCSRTILPMALTIKYTRHIKSKLKNTNSNLSAAVSSYANGSNNLNASS